MGAKKLKYQHTHTHTHTKSEAEPQEQKAPHNISYELPTLLRKIRHSFLHALGDDRSGSYE